MMYSKQKTSLLKYSANALKKASPTILTCIGAVGVVATAILAVKATPKALERVKEAENVKMAENGEKLTRMETIGACWTCYAPAAMTGIATIGCIFSSNVLSRRQQASLASAYALLDRSYKEYRRSVKNVFGEEGHKKVLQDIVEHTEKPVIYGSMSGQPFSFEEIPEETVTFYDAFSRRFFEATPSQVLLAEMHINRNFALNGGDVALEDFYEFLGLSTPEDMKGLAWYVCDYYQWIDFTHTKGIADDGFDSPQTEYWIIDMDFPPTRDVLEDY